MNSKCRVQSKRRCESHESCVGIVGFPACGCQKKSVVYETEWRHAFYLSFYLFYLSFFLFGKQKSVDLNAKNYGEKRSLLKYVDTCYTMRMRENAISRLCEI